MKRRNDPAWGLYVHIPFCRSRCPYCAFYSIGSRSLIPRWLSALKGEVELSSRFLEERSPAFDSIHFGGGTPSLLAEGDIAEILGCLMSSFRVVEGCEIALEVNPLDITQEKALSLKKIGFSRVVVGAQSFDDKALSFLGRKHSARDGVSALEALRCAGFENIGIDLIYGGNGQSVESWVADLEAAAAFSPEHLSCYCLTIEQGTVFGRMAEGGRLSVMSPEVERELFLSGSRLLRGKGYIHYEVSNFARTQEHVSRHNLKYWRREPYLGLGPSAHSFDGKMRWWNRRSVKAYCAAVEAGLLPVEEREVLTEEQAELERISMGLRIRDGFRLDERSDLFIERMGLERMVAGGFIAVRDNTVTPTIDGFLVSDRLPLEITN